MSEIVVLDRLACAPSHEDGVLYEAKPLEFTPPKIAGKTTFVDRGLLPVSARDLPLTEADLVISAGAGVHDWPSFFRAADHLSAAVAGSRVVCDAGDLPRSRQVGASGSIIEAKCYLAFGISGAPQHLQGIQSCRHVIAVNTDEHAPIMKRADLAIVGDAEQIIRNLNSLIERHGQ